MMRNKTALLASAILLLSIALASSVSATGGQETVDPNDPWFSVQPDQEITLTATVTQIGEYPFFENVLVDSYGHEWKVNYKEVNILNGYEGKKITVLAKVTQKNTSVSAGGAEIMSIAGNKTLKEVTILEN